jgi:leader peptidase (prepilin peptidase)/N-methyltransferase
VAALGLPPAAIDLACLRLPDPLVGAANLAAATGLTVAALVLGTADPLLRAVAGALCSAGAYVVLALLPGSHLRIRRRQARRVLGLLLRCAVGRPYCSDCCY